MIHMIVLVAKAKVVAELTEVALGILIALGEHIKDVHKEQELEGIGM